ncbi:hypothetical protein P7K49_027987 [Saguinus oedipus]|uniref:Uncharacterized protein n=1 Tax=Saguinus oedipus TaxID=9490 RepID=A0ABQ9UAY6_SAGOE|nr:hypothetical protein P7K49_027987 [Saguinus oedipus]
MKKTQDTRKRALPRERPQGIHSVRAKQDSAGPGGRLRGPHRPRLSPGPNPGPTAGQVPRACRRRDLCSLITCGAEPQGGRTPPGCHASLGELQKLTLCKREKRHWCPLPSRQEREAELTQSGREEPRRIRGRGRPASYARRQRLRCLVLQNPSRPRPLLRSVGTQPVVVQGGTFPERRILEKVRLKVR